MKKPKVFFLAANTGRSQIYAQAMLEFGLLPERTLIFGQNPKKTLKWENTENSSLNLEGFSPNMDEQIADTLEKGNAKVEYIKAANVNDVEICKKIVAADPDLVIYSGYGGQILKSEILTLGTQFLHLHAGLLPNYKGSTTVYYSWLQEKRCSVSAILLDHNIDTGPIIATETYPPPEKGVDVDIVYDNCLRANLMVKVLDSYCKKGNFTTKKNDSTSGKTYYVIHPLLKHIALLSQENFL
tara:strand:+ start:327 stop:1049 length:723 start_codon:yes stop_codon:yes gene_type:complete